MNVRQALITGSQLLRDFKLPSAELDAELLLSHALSKAREHMYTNDTLPVTTSQRRAFRQLLARRASGEPVAYLVGIREFYGLPLRVNRHVLIPRPETETLVEQALTWLQRSPRERPRVVDVGTGSGAIALALAKHAGNARILGVDVSAAALSMARRNAKHLKLEGTVSIRRSDLLSRVRGPVDLVVANLPYLTRGQLASLPDDIKKFEPGLALDGGPDGLFWYERLLRQVPSIVAPGGALMCEIGPNLRVGFERLVGQFLPAGCRVRFADDLAGRTRVAIVPLVA